MKQLLRDAWAKVVFSMPMGPLLDQKNYEMFQAAGVHILPVNFYSGVPNTAEIDRAIWDKAASMPGVNQNIAGQTRLLDEIGGQGFLDEYFSLPATSPAPETYSRNGGFGAEDGALLYSIIRKYQPKRMIEIGAGQSTLLSAIALEKNNKPSKLTTIDPYAPSYLEGKSSIDLLPMKVETIPLSLFDELDDGDILFIDSSHTVRIGGDVIFEVLEVLPRLKRGVIIHIHDIFLPHHYPKHWILDRHITWTEQYLIQAFLSFNSAFEVMWGHGMMYAARPDLLAENLRRDPAVDNAGSLWLRKTA
jgi:predicted O-methyltransferase YrrM